MSVTSQAELQHLIDCVDLIYRETIALCRGLSDEQSRQATGCPGWTVKDQLAHMVGFEQTQNGAPEPTIELPDFDHLQSDIGRYMETHVYARRSLPLAAIADELAGLHPRRIANLRDQARQGDVELTMPWGAKRPLSESLGVRVLDLWSHEQDIRIAVGVAPRTDGPDGDLIESRVLGAWQALLPKSVDGPGLVRIAFTDGNGSEAEIDLGVHDRAGASDSDPPELSIDGTRSVLSCLGFGRQPRADYLAQASIEGDQELRGRVVARLAFTP